MENPMKKTLLFITSLLTILQLMQATQKPLTIAIFCSGSNEIDKEIQSTSYALGKYLGANNVGIITGGGSNGLMKSVCDGYVSNAATLDNFQSIILRRYANNAHPSMPIFNIRWTESTHEQLESFYQSADIFIALPGGFGTLLEIADCIAHNKQQKPILLLNLNSFWEPLIEQFEMIIAQNSQASQKIESLIIVSSLKECIEQLTTISEQDQQ